MIESLLSSESEDYGTAYAYAELSRYVLDGIDCDPASSSYWNHHVIKARTFYDERIDGLKAPWFGKVHHNAPSNRELKMTVRPWWERLIGFYLSGEVDSAIWVGFQLGQLQTLQSAPQHPLQFFNLFPASRIDFLRRGSSAAADVALKVAHPGASTKQLEALRAQQIAGRRGRACIDCGGFLADVLYCARCPTMPPQPAGSPTHANYITLLPTRRSPAATRAMVGRFLERCNDLQVGGAPVRPV